MYTVLTTVTRPITLKAGIDKVAYDEDREEDEHDRPNAKQDFALVDPITAIDVCNLRLPIVQTLHPDGYKNKLKFRRACWPPIVGFLNRRECRFKKRNTLRQRSAYHTTVHQLGVQCFLSTAEAMAPAGATIGTISSIMGAALRV